MAEVEKKPSQLLALRLTSFADLPSDVTKLIFSFLSNRGLVFAVSCVCKRWRQLAFESITSVGAMEQRGLSLFPAISELDYSRAGSLPNPPPRALRRLKMATSTGQYYRLPESYSGLTSLERLDVQTLFVPKDTEGVAIPLSLQQIFRLVPFIESSLTSLALDLKYSHSITFDITIRPLSRLTHLRVCSPGFEDPWNLHSHTSKLISLSLSYAQVLPSLLRFPFPHLSRLHLDVPDGPQVTTFVNSLTLLSHLSLSLRLERLGELGEIARTALRHLCVCAPQGKTAVTLTERMPAAKLLGCFPNLTTLGNQWQGETLVLLVDGHLQTELLFPSAPAAYLEAVAVCGTISELSLGRSLVNLTSLIIDTQTISDALCVLAPGLWLPNLCRFTSKAKTSNVGVFRLTQALVEQSSRSFLSVRLTLWFEQGMAVAEMASLMDLLRWLDRRAVRNVTIRLPKRQGYVSERLLQLKWTTLHLVDYGTKQRQWR